MSSRNRVARDRQWLNNLNQTAQMDARKRLFKIGDRFGLARMPLVGSGGNLVSLRQS